MRVSHARERFFGCTGIVFVGGGWRVKGGGRIDGKRNEKNPRAWDKKMRAAREKKRAAHEKKRAAREKMRAAHEKMRASHEKMRAARLDLQ